MGKDGTLTSLIVSQAEYLEMFFSSFSEFENSANKFIFHRALHRSS